VSKVKITAMKPKNLIVAKMICVTNSLLRGVRQLRRRRDAEGSEDCGQAIDENGQDQKAQEGELVEVEFFWAEEEQAAKRVAVLGAAVANNLFGADNPIGEIIRIEKIPFEVVGTLKPKGITLEGANEDDQIIIPLRTALRRVFNQNHINKIYVQATRRETMKSAEAEIRQLLWERHRFKVGNRPDDFIIQNQLTTVEAEQTANESFTRLITAIAAISLLVGGIGILAVIKIAVRERTTEIGLRLAVGARRSDILVQFLAESLIQGLVGGLIGVILGVAGAASVGWTTRWHTVIPLDFRLWRW
jgi:putative ABC transport system permease protein